MKLDPFTANGIDIQSIGTKFKQLMNPKCLEGSRCHPPVSRVPELCSILRHPLGQSLHTRLWSEWNGLIKLQTSRTVTMGLK